MTNRDRFGHEMPTIEDPTMNYFDNAIKQLTGAHEDLAADNAKAAAEDYGRCTSNHHACAGRDAAFKAKEDALKKQIVRMFFSGDHMAATLRSVHGNDGFYVQRWDEESRLARELIK